MKVHLEKKKGEEKAGVEVTLYRIKSVLDNKVKQEKLREKAVKHLDEISNERINICKEHNRELAEEQERLWALEVVRLDMACEEHARELALVLGLEMSGREILEGLDLEAKTLEVKDED